MVTLEDFLDLEQKKEAGEDLDNLEKLANVLRCEAFSTILHAGNGHPGASSSLAELLTVAYFGGIFDIYHDNPRIKDRTLLSLRGHAGPLRYNIFRHLGWLEKAELLKYRVFGGLPGHEDMKIAGVDISPSGSLGNGYASTIGASWFLNSNGRGNYILAILGDGEEQEGIVAEAARFAGKHRLKRLITLIDRNRKQLSAPTCEADSTNLEQLWEAYGWNVMQIRNGHDIKEIYDIFQKAKEASQRGPVCILAETIKGLGIPGNLEEPTGYHQAYLKGYIIKPTPLSEAVETLKIKIAHYDCMPFVPVFRTSTGLLEVEPKERKTINIDPEKEKGNAFHYFEEFFARFLEKTDSDLYVLTADYVPQNFLQLFRGQERVKYVNVGIREQYLIGMVHGIQILDPNTRILVLYGDAFIGRAMDQILELSQSDDNAVIYSYQAGLSGALNGMTHQSAVQTNMLRSLPNVTIYEPNSKTDFFRAMNVALDRGGINVIRAHKLETPFEYRGFKPGPYYEIGEVGDPDACVVANGMVLDEAVNAVSLLRKDGIECRLINLVEHNFDGIEEAVPANRPLITVYNGHPYTLAEPLSKYFAGKKFGPSHIVALGFTQGETGEVHDLLRHFGLNAESIARSVASHLETL
ncbi:MAG TPA: transketolase C-terminal domain-containing protein [Candidatus Nanoarchaeia archaeon]|nr:transketolase C-terminal domain-containing protein [Candidatus Nanoarchaeia archaeon]